MISKKSRTEVREKKHLKLRSRFSGTAERPRLSVYRSNKHIYAQLIDDDAQCTLASASTVQADIRSGLENTDDVAAAEVVGKAIAEKALALGIKDVVFDRGGYIYHGKVAALAEAAREAGLNF